MNSLFRLIRPGMYLMGLLLFMLGTGIAIYLGRPIDWQVFLLGLGCILLLQLAAFSLRAYFETRPDDIRKARARREEEPDPDELDARLPRSSLLVLAFSALAISAALTVLLGTAGALSPIAILFLALIFFLTLAYAVPPMQLSSSPYGDLVNAIIWINLAPAFAYQLQTGELHRLLGMLTFPLTALYLAMRLALSLQSYLRDTRRERRTMMVQLGWQRGMNLHNVLVLAGYFLVALAVVLGLPWELTWPALLTFPIGLFQIVLMWQIQRGMPPAWRLLRITALASFALLAYQFSFALWVG